MARKRRGAKQLELADQTAPVVGSTKRRRLARTLPPRLPAVAGDKVPARVQGATGIVIGDVVLPRCREHAGRAWLCISCGQYLVNEAQRDFHCETGAHVLARVCMKHGAEAPGRKELNA